MGGGILEIKVEATYFKLSKRSGSSIDIGFYTDNDRVLAIGDGKGTDYESILTYDPYPGFNFSKLVNARYKYSNGYYYIGVNSVHSDDMVLYFYDGDPAQIRNLPGGTYYFIGYY